MLPSSSLSSLADGTLGDVVRAAMTPQACGYFASVLVFATFWMQRMVPLRLVAICSNVAFFTYAVRLGLAPIAILHAGLLPVNVWRLWQLWRPARAVRAAGAASMLKRRYAAEGAAIAALSLLFVGAAASDVDDNAVHCRIEQWRDCSTACREMSPRALSMADPPANAASAHAGARTSRPTAAEVGAMIRAARTNPRGRRDAMMIQMSYRLGLRPAALLHLRWSDVGPGRTLHVRDRPRRALRRYLLSVAELRELRLLRHEMAHRSAYVFASSGGKPLSRKRFDRIVARAVREAKIRVEVTPQALWQAARRD